MMDKIKMFLSLNTFLSVLILLLGLFNLIRKDCNICKYNLIVITCIGVMSVMMLILLNYNIHLHNTKHGEFLKDIYQDIENI